MEKNFGLLRHLFYTTVLLIFCSCTGKNSPNNDSVIALGNQREIFVDNYLIEKLDGTYLVLHHPVDRGPVFYFNKPWEGDVSGYVTVIKEPDLYRMYFRGLKSKKNKNDTTVVAHTCYAESKDGIQWERPALGLVGFEGSSNNNILDLPEPATHNFSPFLDTNPNVLPAEKYKALAGKDRKDGLVAYSSPDGIHWKKMQEKPVITDGVFDSQNVAFWSESEGCYVSYFRTWTEGNYKGFRSVSRATSPDFIHWSATQSMTFGDTPLEHLYTNQTSPYFRAPQIYLSIGARFSDFQVVPDEQALKLKVDSTQWKGVSDAYFMSTRGGTQYDRTFMESFIRPGIGLNNWTARCNYPALNVVQTGANEMSVYLNQDYAQPTANLHRYSLRLDGFTSINAPFDGGEVLTKPFTFSGDILEINYSTSAVGEIRFEIQNKAGKPIEGFEMEKSKAVIGNEIAGQATWEGNKSLASLNGKIVRLHIYMKDADLYSLRFRETNND